MAPPPPRIAFLLVPDLPLAAILRAHPELHDRPLALASGPGPRAEILCVSPQAARAGVRPHTRTADAQAICAALCLRIRSPALERAARDALLDAALSTSPRAELAPPASGPIAAEAAVFVDARGVCTLFRSERGFASTLAERARRLGLPGVVSIASSRNAARIAARASTAHRDAPLLVLPPGDDADFLGPLPLDLLDPDDDLAEALGRFGLRRVEDLLRIPERALVTRLGRRILPLLQLARGEDPSPPPSAPTGTRVEEAIELEAPVFQLEPLLFALRAPLRRLADRLACRGLAAGHLEIDLELEGGGRDCRRVGAAFPLAEPRIWLRLVALSLQSRPPPAAVLRAQIASRGQILRRDQLDLFRPPGPSTGVLSRTLAELRALCGADRVGAPALVDDHRPDTVGLGTFPPPAEVADAPSRIPMPVLALRALRPPLPARVHERRGCPAALQSALANGEVVRCAGPWRTTGRWWNQEERFAFDHFDVQTEDGLVVRLRHDHLRHCWEIDGLYD